MQAKPCPFCGMHNNLDIDTLYPNGIAWRQSEGYRHYVQREEGEPKENWCYKVICNENYGGCGAEMHGDSIEEVVQKWNNRK